MSDKAKEFGDGWLDYKVNTLKILKELKTAMWPESEWEDGYVAFSRGECRWCDIPEDRRAGLWNERVSGIRGVEGYLMELNLWRSEAGVNEEICIERQDSDFYCQYWRLDTKQQEETNCYYRHAETIRRDLVGRRKAIFKSDLVQTIEVIAPENRLHFFITGRQS